MALRRVTRRASFFRQRQSTDVIESYLLNYKYEINWRAHEISKSYTMVCLSVRGDNPQAPTSGLSRLQVGNHGSLPRST